MEIKDIPIKMISVHENVRMEYNNIDELADSIKSQGLLSPIIVTHEENDRYSLIAGHRRLKACQLLKYETISAIVRTVDNVKLTQLIENVQRSDLTKLESSKAVVELLNETGLSEVRLSKQLGKSATWVGNRRAYYNVISTLDPLNIPDISLTVVKAIHQVSSEYWELLVKELSNNVYTRTYEIQKDISKIIAKSEKNIKVKCKAINNEKATLDMNKIYLTKRRFPISEISSLRYTMTFVSERHKTEVLAILKQLGGEII